MAVQKNFVIRNGLEVDNNLLVADSVTNSVGIGTSTPNYTFEVIGGIGATHINILGISTVLTEFNVGTGGTVITSLNTGLTGFGTQIPAYIVDIRSPVSTGQTALYVQGDVRITGDLSVDDISFDQATLNNLEVTGVGTIATASIDLGYVKTGIVTNLSTSGIATIATASVDLAYVKTGIVTNLSTSGIATITTTVVGTANVNTGVVTTISGSNLNYSGIGSFGSVNTPTARIVTGIVTTIDNANLRVSGIASVNTGVVTSAFVNTGIITTLSGSNLNYSGIGSFGSVNADTGRINTGIVTNLTTSGIATITTAVIGTGNINTGVVTTISGSNLNYSGIGSFGSVNASTGRITTGIITTLTGTTLNYSGIGTITNFNATNANVSGVTTTGSLAVNTGFDVYAVDSTFHGSVTIEGNLSIGGTSTIINAAQLRVEDKDIVLGFTTSQTPSDDTANHGGIAIASTEGTPLVSLAVAGINTLPDTYKQIMWVKRNTMGAGTTDAFLFNYGVGIGSTQVPTGVRLSVGSVQISDNLVNTTNLNATGVTTSNSYNIGGTQVISSGRQLQNIVSLDATTTATIETAIANAPNTSQDIVVTGIASINTGVFTSFFSPTGIITTLSGANINYSGIGSFGSVNAATGRITTGIVTNLSVSGVATFQSDVRLGDNDKIILGDGDDLQIYHDGSNSYILDNGTGSLRLTSQGTSVDIIKDNGENLARFVTDGAAELYYDSVKEFETTGYGATVYGVLQSQGLNSSGIATISVNSSSDALRITQTGAGNALVVEDETNPDTSSFVVTNTGTVGIRTNSPGSTVLNVFGSGNVLRLGNGIDTHNLRFSGPNNWDIQFDTTSDNLSFRRNSTNFVTIDSFGSLGVGTISPFTYGKFAVFGTPGSGAIESQVVGGTNGGDYAIFSVSNGTTRRGRLVADASIDALRIDTAGGSNTPITILTGSSYTERVRVSAGGTFYVGTTNQWPGSTSNTIAIFNGTILCGNTSGLTTSSTGTSTDTAIICGGDIEFARDGVSGTQRRGKIRGLGDSLGGPYSGGIAFDYLFYNGSNYVYGEGLRINSNGRVGVASTAPTTTLDVGGTASIKVPVGTTGERPGSPVRGFVRFNTDLNTFEGYNGTEWGGLGGAAEKDTAVSTTSATTCESFAVSTHRSATITAQITQGSNYQVGKYVVIHDGTTATLIEESAIATGSMLGSFTATISGGNLLFQVNMSSASSATVTTLMTKISV